MKSICVTIIAIIVIGTSIVGGFYIQRWVHRIWHRTDRAFSVDPNAFAATRNCVPAEEVRE